MADWTEEDNVRVSRQTSWDFDAGFVAGFKAGYLSAGGAPDKLEIPEVEY